MFRSSTRCSTSHRHHLTSYKKHTLPSLSRRDFHGTPKLSRGMTEIIEEMRDPDTVNKKEKEKEYMQRMQALQFVDDWEFYDDPLSKAFVTKVWKMIRGPDFESSESALEMLDASELYQVMRRKYPGMMEEQIRDVVRQMMERVDKYRKRKDNIYEYLWRMSNKRAVERITSRIVGRNRTPYLSMAESFMELLYEPSTVSRQSAQLLLRNDVRGRHLHTFLDRLHDVFRDAATDGVDTSPEPAFETADTEDEIDDAADDIPEAGSQETEDEDLDEGKEKGEADDGGASEHPADQSEFDYDPPGSTMTDKEYLAHLVKDKNFDRLLEEGMDLEELDYKTIAEMYDPDKADAKPLPGEMEKYEDTANEEEQYNARISSYASEMPDRGSFSTQRSLQSIKSLARMQRHKQDIDEGLLMPLDDTHQVEDTKKKGQNNETEETEEKEEEEDENNKDDMIASDLEDLGAPSLSEVQEALEDEEVDGPGMLYHLKENVDQAKEDVTVDDEPMDVLYYAFKPVIEEFIFKEDRPPLPPYIPPRKVNADGSAWGTGRRKESSARVQILPAAKPQPSFTINGRPYNEYFTRPRNLYNLTLPFKIADAFYKFDVRSWVRGGGLTGQSEALRKALADAFINYYPELRPMFKGVGLVRRDSRVVERKKTGQEKARKKFTWVKR